jgi:hypothetical protein
VELVLTMNVRVRVHRLHETMIQPLNHNTLCLRDTDQQSHLDVVIALARMTVFLLS